MLREDFVRYIKELLEILEIPYVYLYDRKPKIYTIYSELVFYNEKNYFGFFCDCDLDKVEIIFNDLIETYGKVATINLNRETKKGLMALDEFAYICRDNSEVKNIIKNSMKV